MISRQILIGAPPAEGKIRMHDLRKSVLATVKHMESMKNAVHHENNKQ
ncbi:MAG: hypothetical protein ACI9J2_002317 [Saprospiraceae bacterium]|jgi:hypothetical protein